MIFEAAVTSSRHPRLPGSFPAPLGPFSIWYACSLLRENGIISFIYWEYIFRITEDCPNGPADIGRGDVCKDRGDRQPVGGGPRDSCIFDVRQPAGFDPGGKKIRDTAPPTDDPKPCAHGGGGRLFYDRAKTILWRVGGTWELALSSGRSEPAGRLHISAPVLMGQMLLAPKLPAFLARHPSVAIDLRLIDRAINLFMDNIHTAIRVGRLPDSQPVARKLADAQVIQGVCGTGLFATARHLSTIGRTQSSRTDLVCRARKRLGLRKKKRVALPIFTQAVKTVTVSGPILRHPRIDAFSSPQPGRTGAGGDRARPSSSVWQVADDIAPPVASNVSLPTTSARPRPCIWFSSTRNCRHRKFAPSSTI